jgi:hypothetical protein
MFMKNALTYFLLISLGAFIGVGTSLFWTQRARLNTSASMRQSGELIAPVQTVKLEQGKISYHIEDDPDGFAKQVLAKLNGQTYVVIPFSDEKCLRVADQRDYDGDGWQDVLIEDITACGGNGSQNQFFFISFNGKGYFGQSEPFGNTTEAPSIQKYLNQWSVLAKSNHEGINTDPPLDKLERFVLTFGRAFMVESSEVKSIQAVKELLASEMPDSIDESKELEFDLNADGELDKIVGTLWGRWGRIMWSVEMSSGEVAPQNDYSCKRLGVLESVTKGVHDLVCDQDTILRWNGGMYATEKQ